MYESGVGYSALNTARSALSTIIIFEGGHTVGTHPLVKRYMKGVFNLRPTKPRYSYTWDVSVVLQYLDTLMPLKSLDLKMLTLKLVMLIALTTGQRCQSIQLMNIEKMQKTVEHYRFIIDDIVKTTSPNNSQPVLILPNLTNNLSRCVVHTLEEYLFRTLELRNSKSLFVSYVKPFNAVSKDTISRWIKIVLDLAGINTSIFKAHSTRSASTSAAKRGAVPLLSI